MTAVERETARLKRCREAFERALADGVTVVAAGERLTRERWAATDARLARRRGGSTDVAATRPDFWWGRD